MPAKDSVNQRKVYATVLPWNVFVITPRLGGTVAILQSKGLGTGPVIDHKPPRTARARKTKALENSPTRPSLKITAHPNVGA